MLHQDEQLLPHGTIATTACAPASLARLPSQVDSGFNVDNVLGPTEGRVGILYLSGEGEFVLVDEQTGAETRQEVRRPGGRRAAAAAGRRRRRHACHVLP